MTNIPLYRRIANIIISQIRGGEYPVGSILPTLDELCAEHEIGRVTAQNVLKVLVDSGYASASRGRKTTATMPGIGVPVSGIRNKSIGIIYGRSAFSMSPMIPQMLQLLQQNLLELNARPHLMPCDDQDYPAGDSADGYIIVGLTDAAERCRADMAKHRRPLVGVSTIFDGIARERHVDLYLHFALLASSLHVIELGMRKFILIGIYNTMTPEEIVHPSPRMNAFERTVAGYLRPAVETILAHGFGLADTRSIFCPSNASSAAELISGMLDAGSLDKGTAFLASVDYVALGICKTLMSAGWVPRKDFSVVGAGDQPEVASFMPAITGFDAKLPVLCAAAVASLEKQFVTDHRMIPGKIIESQFHIRET